MNRIDIKPMTAIGANTLSRVTGGTVNKNPNPGKLDNGIDAILNGKNYDAIAARIADSLNPVQHRTRAVDNQVDIYDCDI